MNKLIQKPHLPFFFTALVVLIFGLKSKQLLEGQMLDINIKDSYFVISNLHLAIGVSMLFIAIGSIYWLMQKVNKPLSKWMTVMHLWITLGGTILVLLFSQLYSKDFREFEFNNNLSYASSIISMLVILAQLIFPINIIYAFMKK